MKEIPKLFNTAMVQALLANEKTNTRRLINPKGNQEAMALMMNIYAGMPSSELKSELLRSHCPYKVGDLIWVRETWAKTTNVNSIVEWPGRPHMPGKTFNGRLNDALIYRADGYWQWCDDDGATEAKKSYWKPSIFMPKGAARILLEIEDVRVEFLHDITEEDAQAEGVGSKEYHTSFGISYKSAFANLWVKINGSESWELNPLVWVVKFKVLSTTGKPLVTP